MATTTEEPAPDAAEAQGAPGRAARVVIKKYANRRLYNTASSTYVTLDHLAEMVREGVDFVVYDAKSNDDITRQVLTQIIFEEESRGQNMLPVQFLRQLIRLYGDQMQRFVPSFLEASLDAFARQQDQVSKQFSAAAPGANPWEEQVRANLALFERAMKMFTPFGYRSAEPSPERPAEPPSPAAGAAPTASPPPPAGRSDDLADLRTQMATMQAQLARLAEKG